MIVGADAVQMYPSLEAMASGRAAKRVTLESKMRIDGVNYREASRYLAMELGDAERAMSGLRRVLPVRRYRKGTKPGVTGPVAVGPSVDDDSQWIFPSVEPTEKEKRMMVATVVEVGVRTVFKTHLYQFGGHTYHQQAGGPIGLRVTGAVARIVMGEWDAKLVKTLADSGMTYEEAARYVDDVRMVLRAVKLGWRWDGKRMIYKEEWKNEEHDQGLTKTRKTAMVLETMMNSILSGMTFTVETHEDFDDQKLPTLDTKLWMEGGKIKYEYFEKSMNNKLVIHQKSAMSENGKIASLSMEVIRRLKNTSIELSQDRIDGIIDDFTVKLVGSGYGMQQAYSIINAGLKGFEKLLKKQTDGKMDLHRPAASGVASRNRKKLTSKSNWFRKRKCQGDDEAPGEKSDVRNSTSSKEHYKKTNSKELRTTSVLFVEQTPGGELAQRFREKEKELSLITGFKVKIVERNGTRANQLLHKPNPWSNAKCQNEKCYPCENGDTSDCSKRNLVYTSSCVPCKEAKTPKYYVGETSRTSRERGAEHLDDYQKGKEESHMVKHQEEVHHGQPQANFEFRVHSTFQSALARQITEAVLIRRAGEATLNSKGVYNRCALPRLVVECGKIKKQEDSSKTNNIDWVERGRPTKRTEVAENRKPNKKIKLDREMTGGNLPRCEGIQKRKRPEAKTPGSLEVEEFNQQCKKLRPSFDPVEEYEQEEIRNAQVSLDVVNKENCSIIPIQKKKSKLNQSQTLFPIFNKTASTSTNQKRKKVKSTPSKSSKAQNGSGVKGEKDIRVYFNAQKDEHSQMPGQERKGISVQLSQITTKKLEDRGGESDLEVRDSGLKGERS